MVYGDRILGKPKDKADAFRMLTLLQGHAHEVYTGFCLITPEGAEYLGFSLYACLDGTHEPGADP